MSTTNLPTHPLANSELGAFQGHRTTKQEETGWETTFFYEQGAVTLNIGQNKQFEYKTVVFPRDVPEVVWIEK